MRRWPEEAGHAIGAGIEGDDVPWRRDCIQERNTSHDSGGQALPIRWAKLTIGGRTHQAEVDARSGACVFEVDLQAGPDRLVASFHDEGERTLAPHYVYVRRGRGVGARRKWSVGVGGPASPAVLGQGE